MLKQFLKKCPPDNSISLDGFEAAVKFSARRRTLTIKVDEGCVVVRAPTFAAMGDIENFLRSKRTWVREKLAQQQAQLQARKRFWRSGELLPLLGATVQLQVEHAAKGQVAFDGENLRVGVRRASAQLAERRIQALVQQWYRERAASDIAQRVAHWQEVTGIAAKGHSIKTYKARWGACSHRRELTFNWKLVMAPPAVIDYVVVHELCHIVHFNHSPAYWQLVGRYQPDYKAHKRWLKNHGLSLEL